MLSIFVVVDHYRMQFVHDVVYLLVLQVDIKDNDISLQCIEQPEMGKKEI